jgi:hypothetical protein
MTVNQANQLNAKASRFEFFQVPVTLASANDAEFALAA